jgi:hypothetical protein
MAVTRPRPRGFLFEIRVRGILYLRIERIPRWLASGTAAAISAVVSSLVLARR